MGQVVRVLFFVTKREGFVGDQVMKARLLVGV